MIVFEDLEPDLGPERAPHRAPRWLPVGGAVVVVGVVAALVTRGGDARPTASSVTPSPSVAASFVPTAARGVVAPDGSGVPVIVMDLYALPGVMTVPGRQGWQFDAAASTAEVRQYRAVDLATGTLRPTVRFGIADRSPPATIEAEAQRYTDGLTAGGASGFTSVLVAFGDTMAADLTYTTAGGRYVMERVWLRDGMALFIRVSDVWAETVTSIFDDTVRYGAITP